MTANRAPTQLLSVVAEAWRATLGSKRVGPDSNFFDDGGTSLAATELAARLRVALDRPDVTVGQVLRGGTIGRIAALLAAAPSRAVDAEGGLDSASVPAPATVQQQAIWFLEQFDPDRTAYNAPIKIDFAGPVDVARLRASCAAVVERHPILRTRFVIEGGVLIQKVEPAGVVAFDEIEGVANHAIDDWITDLARRPFDVARLPLIRWLLFARPDGAATLAQIEHHFVHDGWSAWLILHDLAAAYRGDSPSAAAQLDYAAYARWQRLWLDSDTARTATARWAARLADGPHVFRFADDARRPRLFDNEGGHIVARFPDALRHGVLAGARDIGVTPFSLLMAGFVVLLGELGNTDALTLGTMLRNRRLAGSDTIVGMFVNTLALPFGSWREQSFRTFAAHVMDVLADANDDEGVPFPLVVRTLAPPRDPSRNPVFQVCMSMNDWRGRTLDFGPQVAATVAFPPNGGAKFDLDVVVENPETLTFLWRYYSALFDADTIRAMIARYERLLAALLREPDVRLHNLSTALT